MLKPLGRACLGHSGTASQEGLRKSSQHPPQAWRPPGLLAGLTKEAIPGRVFDCHGNCVENG